MKVAEAKKKICPFSIKADRPQMGDDIVTFCSTAGALCVAGDCMAWRFIMCTGEGLPEDEKEGYCLRLKGME